MPVNLPRQTLNLLGRRLPITDGEVPCDGLDRDVTIRRDEYGIPHIYAQTDWDAWFAIGFCQGQDRAFQLEMMIRSVRGTLAETFGEAALPIDRMSRRAGIHRSAAENLSVLDDEVRQMFTAFAEGVNAGREVGTRRPAHEFILRRMKPTDWTAADSLGYYKFMSLAISTNWAEELARLKILLEDGVEALEMLEPGSADWLPVTSPPGTMAGESASSLFTEARSLAEYLGSDEGGSNNWVVSGERTASGRPILANDTHLAPSLPTHFYLAHVKTPEWGLAGGVFVGAPGFFLGHNGFAAWGITVGFLDTTDLFIEEIGNDGRSVREGDEFVPCEVRTEHIRVKDGDDVIERVLETPRGPIVGPAMDGDPGAISLCSTWLRPARTRSVFGAHRWRSFDDFKRDLEQHPQLPLNFVYADETGDIGWILAGQIPQRVGCGGLPLPASDPDNHWRGEPRVSDERLIERNPSTGYIATANNRPTTDCEAAGFGIDWAEGFRQARIQELFDERDDWTAKDMWRMQLDMQSLPWRELQPLLMIVEPTDDESAFAQSMLRHWGGCVSPASTSATVFEVFVSVMLQRIAKRAAPNAWQWALGKGGAPPGHGNYFGSVRFSQLIRLLHDQPEGWFAEGWPRVIAESMSEAIQTIRDHVGPEVKTWQWGRVHPLVLGHTAGQGLLEKVFNRGPYAIGGDNATVHAAGVRPTDPLRPSGATATARTVIEIGDWDNARFVLLGGQSGNPLSPHYDDQIPIWRRGQGIPIAWSDEAVKRATRAMLRLRPGLPGRDEC